VAQEQRHGETATPAEGLNQELNRAATLPWQPNTCNGSTHVQAVMRLLESERKGVKSPSLTARTQLKVL